MMMNNMMHMTRMMMVRRRKHLLQSRVVDDDVCKIGIDGEDDANDDVDGVMADFVTNWDVGQLIGDAEHSKLLNYFCAGREISCESFRS